MKTRTFCRVYDFEEVRPIRNPKTNQTTGFEYRFYCGADDLENKYRKELMPVGQRPPCNGDPVDCDQSEVYHKYSG